MLQEYLSQQGLVDRVLTQQEIEARISSRRSQKKPVNIIMGQTFDDGQPVDLLKYSLFIINLQRILYGQDVDSQSTILLADHFMTDFNKEMTREEAMRLGRARQAFLERVNKAYGGDIEFQYSSRLSNSREYKKFMRKLERESCEKPQFRETVLKAVPPKRRDNPAALQYPFEEIACIATLDADIKVGPRYEIHYDGPARESARILGFTPYCAIHLTKSRLFGQVPSLDAKVLPEIEEFGILPYQIRSKGLIANRIDLSNFTSEQVEGLIDATNDRKSLIDLLIITELAQQCLDKNAGVTFYAQKAEEVAESDLSIESLRDQAKGFFRKFVSPYFSRS